jgi:hypothetical protein
MSGIPVDWPAKQLPLLKANLDQQQSSAGPGSATAKPLEWYM